MSPEILLVLIVMCFSCMSFAMLAFLGYKKYTAFTDTSNESTSPSSSKSSSSSKSGEWKTTGITFFGQSKADDNGLGYTGIDLFKYGKSGKKFDGKPVFPAAVFQGDGAKYLYKVLEVQCDDFKKNKTVYVHVVDVCDSGQDVCKRNTKKHGFLVDIHATGFAYVGNSDGLLKGKFREVGEIGPNDIDKKNWHGTSILCGCKGDCRGKNATWKKPGSC